MNSSFRLGSDCIYRCDAFQEFIWQKHGFGTREGNPEADIILKQIHSNHVFNVNGWRKQQREREGDALITDQPGKSIGIRTADCVPILLLDCRKRVVGAVHAGWRGTAGEICKATLDCMHEQFGTVSGDIYAAFGPCVSECCYAVGPEVAQQFTLWFPEWKEEDEQVRKLDLPGTNRKQLESAGVLPSRISDCELCTACQSNQFFSFRREPENPGRMVAAIERLA
jgi:hypothetical protein